MIVFRRRLNLLAVLAGIAGALVVGWRRLYDFYFSPYAYTMARGQFAINSLDIARKNLPFGSGFGTFGSRLAQVYYSPLYYQYHMMTTPGMSPRRPSYACDTFFPCILAESGWLGLIAYCGLIALLVVWIFRAQKQITARNKVRAAVFVSLILVAFEMLEATGTLSFSETYSVLIALSLAFGLRHFSSRTGEEAAPV